MIRFAIGESWLGPILVAASDRGVCAILLGDDPAELAHDLEDRFPEAELIGGDAEFEQLVARVIGLVEMPSIGLDLPLDIRGTAFQQRVWEALREIPPGSTASYADIAKTNRAAEVRSCRGPGLRGQCPGGRHPLPPRRSERRVFVGISLGRRKEGEITPSRTGGGLILRDNGTQHPSTIMKSNVKTATTLEPDRTAGRVALLDWTTHRG